MIGMLRGHVESVDAVSAIIEVGGVGYEVRMPSADADGLSDPDAARPLRNEAGLRAFGHESAGALYHLQQQHLPVLSESP